ncbi:hypothetical protein FB451DRAFT_1187305 [Mycena latifolia]|nr:hypothetical protein FB451DRAFT_1187305 [Mycena latifolia]
MAPLHYLPTARDVDTATATDSAVPDPSSSTTLFGAPAPYLFPSWVGFLGLALFVCMLLATLYWVYRQSGPRDDKRPVVPQVEKPILGRHFSKRPSSSAESFAKARAQMPSLTIALPPRAYTATADNAAPGSEDDLFRRGTVINTMNNMRRPVQVVEQPLMVEAKEHSMSKTPADDSPYGRMDENFPTKVAWRRFTSSIRAPTLIHTPEARWQSTPGSEFPTTDGASGQQPPSWPPPPTSQPLPASN